MTPDRWPPLGRSSLYGAVAAGRAVPRRCRRVSLIGRRFGAYQVQALLGVGGMREVYKG